MGKEIELKYSVESESVFDEILNSDLLKKSISGHVEKIDMHAEYFDTEDKQLYANDIAFRIRKEDDKFIATIKWNEENVLVSGLYKRNEINVSIPKEQSVITPQISFFEKTEIYEILTNLLADNELKFMFQTDYLRKQVKIEQDGNMFVLSYDIGKVIAGEKNKKISEIEIELYSGEVDDLVNFGNALEKKFNLKIEKLTKFAKGLKMLEQKENK